MKSCTIRKYPGKPMLLITPSSKSIRSRTSSFSRSAYFFSAPI
ncbi:hypothetical protein Barb4_04707 [Bacteroidales bacterium Barb4]|nr:hypothetical protein Barb4_04707 [Bacteroidales bacterium Barb4]